jgi:hypothetical protein
LFFGQSLKGSTALRLLLRVIFLVE